MHLLTLRQSACAPAPIPFPPTSLNSQPSFDTSMSNSSQSVEFGLTNQQQYSEDGSKSGRHSAIVQARFDPEQVAGINRYKHFHRPLLPISPLLISPQENGPTADIENDGNDDGQSIDKTSPRRRSSKKRLLFPLKNGCRGSVLLPAIVSNNESNDLLRQRAHSTNGLIKQTAGNKNATFYKAKFVVTGRNLEQTLLPPLSFPAWLDGSSISGKHQQQRALDFGLPNSGHRRCVSSSAIAAISSAALGQQPTMAAKIRAHTKETVTTNGRRPREQKMGTGVTNVEHSRKAIAEAVDEVTTTVRVRRRIIISSDMKTAIPKKEPSISKNASIDSSSSGQPIKTPSNPRRKPLRKGQTGNRKLVTAVESIGTQTECREVVDVVSTDGGGAERQTNTAAVPSGRARATQTEASKLWVAGSHRSSIIGPDVVQLQLLDIIERALDETIDRQSRLRASKKIAISARNQAQIWRDAKEFVLHLLPRSIDLAGRTNRKLSCERSVRSLLKIQLP